jgi:type II secretory pathway component PulJ
MKSVSNKGFSLIEVMVATTILMIIVIMVGNIFRHSSSAWETGYSTAEGASGVRSVLGTVQRELAQAIDGRKCGSNWKHPVDVNGSKITFYRYSEPIKKGSKDKELQKIEYTFERNNVTRSVDGKSVRLFSKQASVGGNSEVDVDFDIGYIEILESDLNLNSEVEGKAWTRPSVWVRARITRTSSFAGMEARSYGPDGVRNTEDDIIAR